MRTTLAQQYTPSVNMRSVQTLGSTPLHLPRMSPACLVSSDTPTGFLPFAFPSRFHLPASLCSTPITALLRYYGGSDSWAALSRYPGLPA